MTPEDNHYGPIGYQYGAGPICRDQYVACRSQDRSCMDRYGACGDQYGTL